jgi:hypothetical protein
MSDREQQEQQAEDTDGNMRSGRRTVGEGEEQKDDSDGNLFRKVSNEDDQQDDDTKGHARG